MRRALLTINILHTINTAAPSSPLESETDVVFLIDVSRGVQPVDYKLEKELVKSLSYHFNISPTTARGSVVVYGNSPKTVAGFTDPNLQNRLKRAPLLSTPRRTDRALEHAARLLSNSQRKGQKIVVLISGGSQTPGGKTLAQAGKVLRDIGIKTFVVSVGKQATGRDYSPLVRTQQDVFKFPSFDVLPWQGVKIAQQIRNSSSKCNDVISSGFKQNCEQS